MNKPFVVTASIAALAMVLSIVVLRDATKSDSQEAQQTSAASTHERVVHTDSGKTSFPETASTEIARPTTTESGFTVMSNGEFVVDEATRSVVEDLSAVEDVAELYAIKDHLQQTLPPAAGERAADLVERYYHYRIALDQRVRQNEVAAIPQDARIGLDALKALRSEFFGEDVTELWFGPEDAIGREMIIQAEGSP